MPHKHLECLEKPFEGEDIMMEQSSRLDEENSDQDANDIDSDEDANAAFIPEVNNELDTQNFEKFEEADIQALTSSKSGPWRKMISSKYVNFVGYTYKNFEIVNDYQVPGMAELKKKNSKPKRPTIKSLFEDETNI
ncbi:serine/threonine-protein kinase 38-like [Forsythia ovata]|uniref:Serine/threonine-protein kinase 38-like n=1 Tax=Forsythia ovata TaxID=205694 RepID=A0ABD1TM71_9LAMI